MKILDRIEAGFERVEGRCFILQLGFYVRWSPDVPRNKAGAS